MEKNAYISKITHGSPDDGKGIRTVVFFSGCDLNCRWCHNPESISYKPVLMYFKNKCIGCGRCMSVCPEVFGKTDNGLKIDRDKCRRCGKCAEGCLGEAIVLSARKMTVDEVFDEIYADRSYYKYSGGGVTFSGGECLKQHTFLKELLIKCREAQINTCVESCLNVSWDIIDEISDYVDSFFADIKLMDTMKHKEYTGVSNEMIFDNIRKLSRKHRDITFRIPLIPGVNDDDENLIDTVKFVQSLDERLDKRIELLRYNDLAEAKYESIQKEFTSFGTFQTYEEIEERVCLMNKAGDNVKTFYYKH